MSFTNQSYEYRTIPPVVRHDRTGYDPLFPFFLYYDYYEEEYTLPLHWHEEFEFLLVLEGTVKVSVNTHQYIAKSGEAVFINSAELHSIVREPADGGPTATCVFLVDPSLLCSNGYDILHQKYVSSIISGKILTIAHITRGNSKNDDILRLLADLAGVAAEKGMGYELQIKSIILNLFYCLVLTSTTTTQNHMEIINEEDSVRIKRVIEHIYENYNRRLTIRELSGLLNMSDGYFNRFFKRFVGKTPIEFINHYKVSQAAKMLRETSKKEIDVALDVGYDNISYFICVFKNILHCTPSAYRKNTKTYRQNEPSAHAFFRD